MTIDIEQVVYRCLKEGGPKYDLTNQILDKDNLDSMESLLTETYERKCGDCPGSCPFGQLFTRAEINVRELQKKEKESFDF